MTLADLVARLRELGFICCLDPSDERTRVFVMKLRSTPGNRLAGMEMTFTDDDGTTYDIDVPSPILREYRDGRWEYSVNPGAPATPSAYFKTFATADEVYEELLHYFFDADSPMRLEVDYFEAGPGRPPGA